MKKSTKMLALGLVVLPCALFMTACGDKETNLVNTKGNYSAVSTTQYSNVVSSLEENGIDLTTAASGVRAVLKLDADLITGGQKFEIEYPNDMKAKADVIDEILDLQSLNASQKNTIKMRSGNENYTLQANTYLTGGKMYYDLSKIANSEEMMSKMIWQLITQQGGISASKYYMNLNISENDVDLNDYNISDLIAKIPEGEYGKGKSLEIQSHETDSERKIKMILDLSAFSNEDMPIDSVVDKVEIYFVYSNDILSGISINANITNYTLDIDPKTVGDEMTISASVSLEIISYNGEIGIPSPAELAQYAEIDMAAAEIENSSI